MTQRTSNKKRWSHHVMETSDALDLEQDIFRSGSAREIASSLKRSAERSRRRKAAPFRSAMSMLVFYINRAGKNLSPSRLRTLERAKDELRVLFGRTPARTRTAAAPKAGSRRPAAPKRATRHTTEASSLRSSREEAKAEPLLFSSNAADGGHETHHDCLFFCSGFALRSPLLLRIEDLGSGIENYDAVTSRGDRRPGS